MASVTPSQSQDPRSKPTSLKAVVFDLGNVLVGWDPYGAVKDRLTPEQWKTFEAEANFSHINQRADGGEPIDKLVGELAAKNPSHGQILRQYFDNFALALTGPIPGTAEVVRGLNSAGFQTLGLTNWAWQTFGHAAKSAPVISELHGVVVSGKIGITKPDARIFEHLLHRYALDPAEVVFVDDSPNNVAAALALGMRAILFEDATRLAAALHEIGLPDLSSGPDLRRPDPANLGVIPGEK